jgi:hypothetical protein
MTRPDRQGKKQVSAFVTLEKWRALRNVATKTARNQTELITEALDDLAAKYGEQPRQAKARNTARALRHG